MIRKISCLFAIIMVAACQAFMVHFPTSATTTTTTTTKIRAFQQSVHDENDQHHDEIPSRRSVLERMLVSTAVVVLPISTPRLSASAISASARIDVNNALAREYTAFPGLFPTIATKIVKGGPYTNKKQVYGVLNELEQSRLKEYDSAIVINKPDAQLKQFKTSQICKYECGNRVSSSYRDEQIKAVQRGRQGLEK